MLANGRLAAAIAGIALMTLLFAGLPARTAPARSESSIGYVDLQLVSDEVKKTREWQSAVGDAIKRTEDLQRQLQEMEELRYLTEAEKKELQALEAKPRATDQEKERIIILRRKSMAIDEEYQELALLTSTNDQQKQRLADLAKARDAGRRNLQQVQRDLQEQVRSLEAKLLADAQSRVLKLVSEVAQQQNLQLVLDRDAILFGGRDLTDAVVKKLQPR